MKVTTGLLAGVAMLVANVAEAQYYGQATVSGTVLSQGPDGFMLRGPDGNYGIAISGNTVFTDPWNNAVSTGPISVWPGTYVSATGYPTSQWVMQATVVTSQNSSLPVYGGGDTTIVTPSYYNYGTSFPFFPIRQSVSGGVSVGRPNALLTGVSSFFSPFRVQSSGRMR